MECRSRSLRPGEVQSGIGEKTPPVSSRHSIISFAVRLCTTSRRRSATLSFSLRTSAYLCDLCVKGALQTQRSQRYADVRREIFDLCKAACTRHILRSLCALLVAVSALSSDAAAQTPRPAPSPSAPRTVEGVIFGPDASLLSLTPEQQRIAYRNLRLLAPHNLVARGQAVSLLPQAPIDLKGSRTTTRTASDRSPIFLPRRASPASL